MRGVFPAGGRSEGSGHALKIANRPEGGKEGRRPAAGGPDLTDRHSYPTVCARQTASLAVPVPGPPWVIRPAAWSCRPAGREARIPCAPLPIYTKDAAVMSTTDLGACEWFVWDL